MTSFREYSHYYDLLYRDKDYRAEADYLDRLIRENCSGAAFLLNLGCGTGNHDLLLAARGYLVTGVDISPDNIKLARDKLSGESAGPGKLQYHEGDIRKIRLNRQFDAVISVFHVMSYLTVSEDLQAAFITAAEHLAPGGVFIFDCWYGPAVLTRLPEVRVRRVEDEHLSLTRIAEPDIHYNANRVDVNYELLVRSKAGTDVKRIRETHSMRYLFYPEIETFLANAGMELVRAEEWLSGEKTGRNSWSGCFIARRSNTG